MILAEDSPAASPELATLSQATWVPVSVMEKAVNAWLYSMDLVLQVEFMHAAHRFSAMLAQGILRRWSCFAGSGIGSKFFATLAKVWHHRFGIISVVDSSVLCERDVRKQVHLQQQVRPAYLVANMKGSASDTAPNLMKGCMVEIPPPASTSMAASRAPAAPP